MKRVLKLLIFAITLISITGCITKEEKEKRYTEIREKVKEAIDWKMKAMYPYCELDPNKNLDGEIYYSNASELMQNGYIKKEELLDVDEKSYCDVYFTYSPKYNIPLNNQEDCYVSYKIYLKCKYLEEDGYVKTEDYKSVYYD